MEDNRTLGTIGLVGGVAVVLGVLARSTLGPDRFAHPNDAASWAVDLAALLVGLVALTVIIDRRHPR